MPTINELITATETKLANAATVIAWELDEVRLATQRLAQAEQRKALLEDRLHSLRELAKEPG